MRRTVRIKIVIDPASLETAKEQALNILTQRAIRGFNQTVGPHLLDVAKSRSPVGRQGAEVRQGRKVEGPEIFGTRPINPRRSSFQPVRLANREEGRFTSEEIDRLRDLRNMTARERANALRSSDIKFFRGTGKNEGRTPDQVDTIRGSIRGAFIHKPGTLRDSHIYVPARRTGPDEVTASVRATAEYAAAQHEGFKHHSHGEATGLQVAGKKWLKSALTNIADDLKSPATYEG